ncbi:bacteriophage abortive infection AbiH family protein, partial [Acinetobacter sp. SM34]|uniref:bacteriophage abortive infection AbiH family protein n=1 Tax=Acinetobacter sp. SM34 TaxID=1301620 RepID=UPI001EDBD4D5|nr:bacteriophage abortive infection AbiH family protein [Acinetobacter sp. SM34]
ISEVYILGHSMAEVDLPYFEELVKSVKPDAKWTVTFYSPDEKQHHFEVLKGLGISNISIVTLQEI